jgi:hypothetical protein
MFVKCCADWFWYASNQPMNRKMIGVSLLWWFYKRGSKRIDSICRTIEAHWVIALLPMTVRVSIL